MPSQSSTHNKRAENPASLRFPSRSAYQTDQPARGSQGLSSYLKQRMRILGVAWRLHRAMHAATATCTTFNTLVVGMNMLKCACVVDKFAHAQKQPPQQVVTRVQDPERERPHHIILNWKTCTFPEHRVRRSCLLSCCTSKEIVRRVHALFLAMMAV